MTHLKMRTLGRTGIPVSEISFGSVPIGNLYRPVDDVEAIEAVTTAVNAGVNLIDTSPHYGCGLAEHRIGTALRRLDRNGLVISTKIGRWLDTTRIMPPAVAGADPTGDFVDTPRFMRVFDYSRDGVMRSVDQSLLRLGIDKIDLLLIHDADSVIHGAAGADRRFREIMEGAYPAMVELREQGVVRGIGMGLNEVAASVRFLQAMDIDVALIAGCYSLLDQPALETFLPLAAERGIGVMLGGVFSSGILATGAIAGARYDYRPAPAEILARVGQMERICKSHGVPLAAAAIQFALAAPSVSTIVLGGATPAEIRANVAAASIEPPAALWSDLKAAGLIDSNLTTPAGV